jgi:hypothetical protein
MAEISPSVWQQNEKGDWRLYYNTNLQLNNISTNRGGGEQSKNKKNNISEKNLLLGTLVMTPKGIGRLIKNDEGEGIIRFKDNLVEEKFPIKEITNDFNCFIYDYSNGFNIIRLKLKVLGSINDIFEELGKIKKLNTNEINYSLIYKGIVLKNDFTFEQLNISNNCKILLLIEYNIRYTLSRFPNIGEFWYSYTIDGICFIPSQNIKLMGIGLFGSHENKLIDSTLKILDGPSLSSNIIYEENIEISPGTNKNNAISKNFFPKSILCKQEKEYSIILISKTSSNCYYGHHGKPVIEGEKGVIFTFKRVQGRSYGSGIESGNFPELYYSIQ